jgi:hypothetical protein
MEEVRNTKAPATDTNAPTALDETEYQAAVERCKAVCASLSAKQWVLGDEADKVEKRYGENRLEQFAEDINFPGAVCTLKRCRDVCRKWPKERARPRFFASAKVLATHDDRWAIVERNPDISKREAREIMRQRRAEQADATPDQPNQAEEGDPIEEEEDTATTPEATASSPAKAKRAAKEKQQQEKEDEWLKHDRKWFKALVEVANEASRVAGVMDQYEPEQLDKLRQAIDPKMLMYVRGGGRMLFRVANRLAELLEVDLEEASAPIECPHPEAPAHAMA